MQHTVSLTPHEAVEETYDDTGLVRILQDSKVIAVVGASPKSNRASYRVMNYMQHNGYRTIPVNPTAVGQQILGEAVYAELEDVPPPVDMVCLFRRPDAVPEVVDQVIALADEKRIRYVWMQLGVAHADAARRAREAGLEVVMDRCLKIEFGRLLSHG